MAIEEQLGRIAHGYRYSFTSDALEHVTELIQQQAGPGFEHIVFVTGGSEAMESALLGMPTAVNTWSTVIKKQSRLAARQRARRFGQHSGKASVAS